MDAQEIADRLNGSEYPLNVPADIQRTAGLAGLVIVFGASDDLMEFAGAISEEIGAYGGEAVRVDTKGIIPDFDYIERGDKAAFRDYFQRESGGKTIEAVWDRDGYSWTYKTDIPHATFDVVEDDGEPYCRGIVFALADTAT